MKINLILLFIGLLTITGAYAQTDSLTLSYFYKKVAENSPVIKQRQLNTDATALKIKSLSTMFFPSINLNGQATYQSDVTSLSINLPIPGFVAPKGVDKDQYKLYVEVQQMIYDGGLMKRQKEIESAGLTADQKNIEVKLYQLKDQVNQAFFMILMLQEKEKSVVSMKDQLKANLALIESGVKNGALKQVNADLLKAELLKTDQQIVEIKYGRKASFAVLSEITGLNLDPRSQLQWPVVANAKAGDGKRPEYDLIELQKTKLVSMSKLSETDRMPKLAAFAQVGYAKPGLNMLKNEFDGYYIVGAKLSWNIFDWGNSTRKQQVYSIQQKSLDTEKENLDRNFKVLAINQESLIAQYEELLKQDEEIKQLRQSISQSYLSQMNNGVLTSSEYVNQLNAETQAKINADIHQLQLLQAKVNYAQIMGTN